MSLQSSQRSSPEGSQYTGNTKKEGVDYLNSDEASRKGSPLPSYADQGEEPGGCLYMKSYKDSESPCVSDSKSFSAEDEKNVEISNLLSDSNMFEQSELQRLRAERLHAEEKLLERVDKTN